MTRTVVPLSALLLTAAGALPFVGGALAATGFTATSLGDRYPLITTNDGVLMLARYGVIILCFMSGVLWGFATKAEGKQATMAYALSVLPALWVFLNPGARADEALFNLIIGFVAVLILDFAYQSWGLAPRWWMKLRIPVTVVVVCCLGIGIWA